MQPRFNWEKKCLHCNRYFKNKHGMSVGKFSWIRFCSLSCYHNARNEVNSKKIIPERLCKYCWKVFYKKVTTSKIIWLKWSKFCCKICADKDRIWIKMDQKTIKKMINSRRIKTENLIDYCSLRKRILKRDNYTCKSCNYSEKEIMEVDHILPRLYFPELSMDINNLQTLCSNCHRRKTLRDIRIFSA